MDQYRYKRLDHDQPIFRLLRLHQGSRGELTCNLFEALLHHDDVIQYEALSYTWGAPGTPRIVTVDEQKLAITENLYQALISLRRPYTDRILWIDAVCIDQSNTKERSHQVAQMSDIYKQADSVVFFLGPATYSTDAFMDYMGHVQQVRSKYAYRSWARDDQRWKIIQEAVQEEMGKLDIDLLSLGLKGLLNRPWFLRVWILQEVVNAKNAIVCCGRKEIAASVFSISPIIFKVSPSVHCQSVIDIMPGPWRKTSWWSKGPCLYTLLSKFGGAQATESQDLIYALRGIATDKESPILTPDYDKSEECLVRDIVRFLFDFEYDAKMGWSMLGTVRDAIRGLEQIKDRIFMERIKTGEMRRLDGLLQAPGFTFSPTVVEAAIQHDKTGQMMKLFMQNSKDFGISTQTLLTAVEKGSVPVVEVLERYLGGGVAAATKETLLIAANNRRHGDDMVTYFLARDPDLGDDGQTVAEVAARNSTQATRIVRQLLGRGIRITMTPQLHKNALKSGCYEELVLLFVHYPPRGLRMSDEAVDVDANKSADGAAENARIVFRSIARFLITYANYEYTLFDVFRQSCRQIEEHGYNFLEELTLCAAEVFKEGGHSLSTQRGQFEQINGTLDWITEESGFSLYITIGVVKASIEGNFTGRMSRLLKQKRDSIDIDPDAAAEIIRTYHRGESDDLSMINLIFQYGDGQFRYTNVMSQALTKRYRDPETRPHAGLLHAVNMHRDAGLLRWLLSCGANPDERNSNGNTLLTYTAQNCQTVALLLSYGADPNIQPGLSGYCALHPAKAGADYEALELFLVCGANPNIVDGYEGNTLLQGAACRGDIGSVKLLLQYGADATIRTDDGKGVEDLTKSNAIISLLREHSSQSLAGMHGISPSVQDIMRDHGLVPNPHNRLLGTRLSWHIP
ncbi:hypothetical protein TGAM01_v210778 [Trichoderma gamsii]|uniref:Heterokaryon incompatibility domain-containing protein n=1 Tax=Trichoderma gamsii TaxID=398673 RepID=A0A2P4Z7S3_9HYPO|nr:hypothetical protein TGAM01_v210778 [Trichoderma gamsii]PON20336.1 hypothetical protein TGAM01_v210778 [Trichoderma gamsii]